MTFDDIQDGGARLRFALCGCFLDSSIKYITFTCIVSRCVWLLYSTVDSQWRPRLHKRLRRIHFYTRQQTHRGSFLNVNFLDQTDLLEGPDQWDRKDRLKHALRSVDTVVEYEL